MEQTILVVSIEVQPLCADLLEQAVESLRDKPAVGAALTAIRTLHYLSMVMFRDQRYDPTLIIEANVDGRAGVFWAELEGAIGKDLREILRCCKRPTDRATAAIYDRVTATDSTMPLAPLFDAIAMSPRAWHMGARGLRRAQIEADASVFFDARREISDAECLRDLTPVQIHQVLRKRLLENHPCLNEPARPRISLVDNVRDWGAVLLFGIAVLVGLQLPGVLLAWVARGWGWAVLAAIALSASVPLAFELLDMRAERRSLGPKLDRPYGRTLWDLVGLGAGLLIGSWIAVAALIVGLRTLTQQATSLRGVAWMVAMGLVGGIVTVLVMAVWIRRLETRESSQDAAPLDVPDERRIAEREDRSPQNHMASLVHVKPGALRAILALVGLYGLSLVMRVERRARQGYLIDVRTIHFANLTLLNNNARLLFLSNFDGTWENYLTDFTEKVRIPLTLVWNIGIGFPPTRFYVFDGAVYARQFQSWKRRSMTPTLFWFQAYPKISVEQIWRQAQLADGLRRATLRPKEAEKWATAL